MSAVTLFRLTLAPCLVLASAVLALGCGPPPTYSEHIAPILQAKCQACHRPGQVAPMSLLTYEDVHAYAGLIAVSIEMGNMPPFYAAGPAGYYKNDLRLTDEEKSLIFDWVDAGSPEGDPALLPPAIEWTDSPWPLGPPDLVIQFPRHSPPRTFRDQHITFVTDYVFSEETWVRALHLKTETSKAVHHSTQFIWNAKNPVPANGKTLDHIPPKRALFTWFPGFLTEPLPDGQAIRIPKGARIASRTHFGPTKEARSEQLELGIYFADGEIDSVQKPLGLQMPDLMVPPGEPNYRHSASVNFLQAALVSHFRIHMHLRGKAAQIIFHFPDGTQKTVFDLPRYRFGWQRYYYLAEPMPVPAGTRAEFVGVWDNSADNPLNPDPTAWCRWGSRTVDEMFGGTVYYTPQRKLAEPLLVENGRVVGDATRTRRASSPIL
jgi:hypothetical protein